MNPGGSIKDRIALFIIEEAEKQGKIKPGDTLIEATAGNTGLGLAQVAMLKGYRLLVVIPDKMSAEKIAHLKAAGAEVIITRSDVSKGHPEYYQEYAARLAQEKSNCYYVNQFANPANALAHQQGLAPEIWEQMQHNLDAVVCGVGTGGHLTGIGHFMRTVAPQVEIILADPKGSILANYIQTGEIEEKGSWLVEGIGEDYIPSICDLSVVKQAITVTDAEAFATARKLYRTEGVFGGSSTGVVVHAALEYCRQQTKPKRVLTFVYDTGSKYLSKMYNDEWMRAHGFAV
jgi:cystathionine beta-synthase